MRRAIGLLPDNALVGLITYGTQAYLHELGFSDLSKAYIFRGTKEISKEQILDQLGLSVTGRAEAPGFPKGGMPQGNGFHRTASLNRFLLPASDCEYTLNALLDELQTDQWPVEAGNRARRCTGVALSVAAGLLGACLPGTGARIVALVGGPCTEGPWNIVSKDLSEPVCSHKDLDKDAVPHFHKAVKFFDKLAKQLVSQGHVLDLFASALDQVGIAEMKVAVERTGGLVVLAESFGHSVFKDSFKRIFETGEQSLGLSFQAFAQLLQAPHDEAQLIIKDRFPVPRLVVCDQHGSQARFLLAKLNPSATYNSAHEIAPGSDVIFTDVVSLQVFCEHLQQLAVQSVSTASLIFYVFQAWIIFPVGFSFHCVIL
ncbi:hypothetical protein AXF42_Ash006136 [Apostasia shenzhenica]|uniref:Protein transport protein SEC23 n=1 Tax=Apostasia shenzhenica TaxID=1088818 RepID=A0A2I0B0D9_9ASPA|nr:hypothetical protein AXF42_Ash006136 [Apostasia shenzhenica]